MSIRKRASFSIAAAFGALAVTVAAQGATDEKVIVCHGTASAINNLVLVEVSTSALNGHFDVEDGVVVGVGHGANNAPDQWSPLNGSGFSGDCRDLYIAEYGGPGGEE